MSVFLSILALIIFCMVHIIDTIVMLFTGVKGRKWYQIIDTKAYQKAFNIDVFGNYQYSELWNMVFSTGGYQFGRFGETLSSCFGKKQIEKTLTCFGWLILILINVVDFSKWFKGGHCFASMQTEVEIINFIKLTDE